MATIPTHAFAGLVVVDLVAGSRTTWKLRAAGALCAALPDLDVLMMRFCGVAYGDPWGHRGASHSLFFAFALGASVAWLFFRRGPVPWERAALALGLATVSQGVLDAMTTGGLGVAFFAPFSNARLFLPWCPIPVAPLSVRAFFTSGGAQLFGWEVLHLWLPLAAVLALVHAERRPACRTRPAPSRPASSVLGAGRRPAGDASPAPRGHRAGRGGIGRRPPDPDAED